MLKKLNRKIMLLFIVVIFLLFIISGIYLFLGIEDAEKEANDIISVDYRKIMGAVKIDYGLNEEANWMDFADSQEIHDFHKQAGSKFIRVWLDEPPHRTTSTIPYKNGVYDFDNLDSFINAVLESGAVPFVIFAYAPEEISSGTGQENANVPIDNREFGAYCANVVAHYKEMCENDKFSKKCSIDEWYWEIWNEPYFNHWWVNSTFIKMYNEAYSQIKNVNSDAKVGGYTLRFITRDEKLMAKWFLENTEQDFISIHLYGNYPILGAKDELYIRNLNNEYLREMYEQEMIANNKYLFYDETKLLKDYVNKYAKKKDIEIIISELGPNWNWKYEPYLDEQFVSAWYASALIWTIKSNSVDKEFYYSGTSNHQDGGFAMWSVNKNSGTFNLFPVYYMKKDFIKYNPKGSVVYNSISSDDDVEVLAVSSQEGKFITLVNKKNQQINEVGVTVKNLNYQRIIDLNNNKEISEIKLNLAPYEVRFIQLV